MDWLEQWFGLNPDGGSGVVEAEIIVALVLALGAGVLVYSPWARTVVATAIKRATSALRLRRHS